ncbi:MAG TPA: transcription antitermination factor NusB [Usitatibacter sp.]|nr:transcription antitermination factor NusB [Usitatibacter sp.]
MKASLRAASRRRSRELALQGLYQWIYTGNKPCEVLKNLSELEGFGEADREFLEAELKGVIAEADGLREHLEPLADRKWDDVSPVERGILLLGAWELVHQKEIPYRVTINEAIELGKRFGGTDGHKYVNGVLDRLAANVRADEVAQKGKKRNGR